LESGYQWEGGGHKERVWEGKYCRNIMNSCMKMKKMSSSETIPGMGERRNIEG
jgi:hypothetical protein